MWLAGLGGVDEMCTLPAHEMGQRSPLGCQKNIRLTLLWRREFFKGKGWGNRPIHWIGSSSSSLCLASPPASGAGGRPRRLSTWPGAPSSIASRCVACPRRARGMTSFNAGGVVGLGRPRPAPCSLSLPFLSTPARRSPTRAYPRRARRQDERIQICRCRCPGLGQWRRPEGTGGGGWQGAGGA